MDKTDIVRRNYFNRLPRLLLFSLGLGLLFWLIDSLLGAYISHNGGLSNLLFFPGSSRIVLRLIIFGFLLAFAVHSNHLVVRLGLIQDELKESEYRYRSLVELAPNAIAIQAIFRDITERKRAEKELEVLRKAVDASSEVIFITDREGIITFINPEFTRLYGYDAGEVVGKTTPRILKSGTMALGDYEEFWETILSKQVAKGEWVNKCRNGDLIDIESSANPILDEKGEIIGFLAIQRDITERKRVENEIRQRNIELEALNAVTSTVSQSLDLNQIINDALDKVLSLGLLGDEAYGMLFLIDERADTLSLVAHRGAPDDHPCILNPPKVGECLCGLAAQRGETIISENCWEDERHTRSWTDMPSHKDISIPLKVRGKILGAMDMRLPTSHEIAPSDIELLESVAGQISIAIENAQLRELRDRAIVGERERIARELHDGLAQVLVYVNTKTSAARLMLEGNRPEAAIKNLRQLEETAQALLIDLREAILGLRMAGEVDKGLATMIKNYVVQSTKLSGLPVEVTIAPEVWSISLPVETSLHLLRIAQEALTNARKHASASQAQVSLRVSEGDYLVLTIVDDGIGLPPEQMRRDDGAKFGISIMSERSADIGAEFSADSETNTGTCITVRLKI